VWCIHELFVCLSVGLCLEAPHSLSAARPGLGSLCFVSQAAYAGFNQRAGLMSRCCCGLRSITATVIVFWSALLA
jgi:hypothetical protein